jgi:hypothetical protein
VYIRKMSEDTMQFVDWESRPAIMLAGRAWAVLEPGGDWTPVHGAEVGDSGRLLEDEEELRATFADWGPLPPFPFVPSMGTISLKSRNPRSRASTETATRQQFGTGKPNSRSLLAKIGVAFFFAAFFGFMSLGLETIEMMPSNASIFINYSTGTYASPPCVLNGTTDAEEEAVGAILERHPHEGNRKT